MTLKIETDSRTISVGDDFVLRSDQTGVKSVMFDVFEDRKGGKFVCTDLSIEGARKLRDHLVTILPPEPEPLTLGRIRGKLNKLPDSTLVEDINLGELDCE